jgi:signal transduction histidine kinase
MGGALAYLLLALPNTLPFVPMFGLSVVGFATSLVWIGIPISMVLTGVWRGLARTERGWLRVTTGIEIPVPYRPLPEGGVFRRWWRGKLRDPATWRDIAYLALRFPLGIVQFVLTVVLWSVALFAAPMPLWVLLLPKTRDFANFLMLPDFKGHVVPVTTPLQALPWCAAGLLVLFIAWKLTPRLAQLQAALGRALLGPSMAAQLAQKADRLQASRARGVDAAEAERRRIERDLHDGAQQRLVAVAMTLGRAKTKLDKDPDALRSLIDEAHSDAKQAVSELRDLARGIYPAVLGDRGLDAALSALAARSPIPTDIEVDVEPRPPAAVESTAYFIVGEALTNIAKHSDAKHGTVRVRRGEGSVVVEVTDDGSGGARIRPGGGLAGLADRAATIDGVITVVSPLGGPTVLRADLPCEW